MWNIIFEVLAYFFCAICFFKVAKFYGSKFKKALSELRHNEFSIGRVMTCDMLDYKRYLRASLLWEFGFYVVLYLFFSKLSALIS